MKKEGEMKTEEEEKKKQDSEWPVNGENTSPKGQPVEIIYAPNSK